MAAGKGPIRVVVIGLVSKTSMTKMPSSYSVLRAAEKIALKERVHRRRRPNKLGSWRTHAEIYEFRRGPT